MIKIVDRLAKIEYETDVAALGRDMYNSSRIDILEKDGSYNLRFTINLRNPEGETFFSKSTQKFRDDALDNPEEYLMPEKTRVDNGVRVENNNERTTITYHPGRRDENSFIIPTNISETSNSGSNLISDLGEIPNRRVHVDALSEKIKRNLDEEFSPGALEAYLNEEITRDHYEKLVRDFDYVEEIFHKGMVEDYRSFEDRRKARINFEGAELKKGDERISTLSELKNNREKNILEEQGIRQIEGIAVPEKISAEDIEEFLGGRV